MTQNDGGDDHDNNNNNFYRAVEWRVHREYNCIMVTRYYNHELRAQLIINIQPSSRLNYLSRRCIAARQHESTQFQETHWHRYCQCWKQVYNVKSKMQDGKLPDYNTKNRVKPVLCQWRLEITTYETNKSIL